MMQPWWILATIKYATKEAQHKTWRHMQPTDMRHKHEQTCHYNMFQMTCHAQLMRKKSNKMQNINNASQQISNPKL